MDKKLFFHFLGWILYFIYYGWGSYSEKDYVYESIILNTSFILISATVFYLFYFLVWEKVLQRKDFILFIVFILLGVAFFIGFRFFVQEILLEITLGIDNYKIKDFNFYVNDNYYRAIPPIATSAIVFLIENKNELDRQRAELQQEKKKAELDFLRSQLNPHFLFNTLSYLYTEAFIVDQNLANNILTLSDILRYSLQSSKDESKTIAEEIKLLQNYISIFNNRFEGKCFVDMKVEGHALNQKIEPLLLIPFIENAFKHGVVSDKNNPLIILLKVEDKHLEFHSNNIINQHKKDPGSGIGLQNVKRRLELLYPSKHELNITETNNRFHVTMKIQL